jgi:hypothetical protein
MGWSYLTRNFDRPVLEFCTAEFTDSNFHVQQSVEDIAYVLADRMVYAALRLRYVAGDRPDNIVLGALLVDIVPGRFGWKQISEGDGTGLRCPLRIMDLLSPTDDPNALAWRAQVREEHRLRARLNGLQPGTLLQAKTPLLLSDGTRVEQLVVLDAKKGLFMTTGPNPVRARLSGWRNHLTLPSKGPHQILASLDDGDLEESPSEGVAP